jgi:hypothetical protein
MTSLVRACRSDAIRSRRVFGPPPRRLHGGRIDRGPDAGLLPFVVTVGGHPADCGSDAAQQRHRAPGRHAPRRADMPRGTRSARPWLRSAPGCRCHDHRSDCRRFRGGAAPQRRSWSCTRRSRTRLVRAGGPAGRRDHDVPCAAAGHAHGCGERRDHARVRHRHPLAAGPGIRQPPTPARKRPRRSAAGQRTLDR